MHLLGPPPPHTHTRTHARTRLADPPPVLASSWDGGFLYMSGFCDLLAGKGLAGVTEPRLLQDRCNLSRDHSVVAPPPPHAHARTLATPPPPRVHWLLARRVVCCNCQGHVFFLSTSSRFGEDHRAPSCTGRLPSFTQPQRGGASPTPRFLLARTLTCAPPPPGLGF